MTSGREDKIRKAAYEIWQRERSPEGRELEHWDEATRQVDREEGSATTPKAGDERTPDTHSADETPLPRPDTPPGRPGRKGA